MSIFFYFLYMQIILTNCNTLQLIVDEEDIDQIQKRVSFLPLEESIIDLYYNGHSSMTKENLTESKQKLLEEKAEKKRCSNLYLQ